MPSSTGWPRRPAQAAEQRPSHRYARPIARLLACVAVLVLALGLAASASLDGGGASASIDVPVLDVEAPTVLRSDSVLRRELTEGGLGVAAVVALVVGLTVVVEASGRRPLLLAAPVPGRVGPRRADHRRAPPQAPCSR